MKPLPRHGDGIVTDAMERYGRTLNADEVEAERKQRLAVQELVYRRAGATQFEVMSVLEAIIGVTPNDWMDADGKPRPFDSWSKRAQIAMQSVKIKERFIDTDGASVVTELDREVKFHDKLKAIGMWIELAKMMENPLWAMASAVKREVKVTPQPLVRYTPVTGVDIGLEDTQEDLELRRMLGDDD